MTRTPIPHVLGALLLPAFAPLLAQAAPQPLPPDRAIGAATIDEDELREWLAYLTSEELAGRGTGSEGYRLAAEFVRERFRLFGLKPGNGEDFFQNVEWTLRSPAPESGLTLASGEEQVWTATLADGLHGSVTVDGENAGKLAIVTTTVDGAIAGLDLKDRAVVLDVRGPLLPDLEERQRPWAPVLALRTISSLAGEVRDAGGTLVAVAHGEGYEWVGAPTPRSSPGRSSAGPAGAVRGRRPNVFVLSAEQLAGLANAAHASLPDDSPPEPIVSRSDLTLRARAQVNVEDAPAYNVLAILPGRDPEVADEYVAIGCHLDHLGVREGQIHPGADDDGSGSVGLLAIAQAFAENPVKPRRSVLFMAFCGEENGLIGSAYFARNPTVPLESIVAELQIDMIGRREESETESAADNADSLHLIGSKKLSNDLHELCVARNEQHAGLSLEWDEENVFFRSDHFNFARHGVPIAFFFTGFHPDYHRPTDTPEKIDYAKLARIATYVYDVAFELAEQEGRPLVDPDLWTDMPRKGREEPAAPVRD